MKDYSIQTIIHLFWNAFQQLGAEVPAKTVEDLGILVHKIMNLQSRSFHTPEHVVDLSDPKDPHQTLAAMFHDIVYFQVDKGFHEDIRRIVGPFITETGGDVLVSKTWDEKNSPLNMTLKIFGFQPGQKLNPFGGLNEFLSAVVLVQTCQAYLKPEDLLEIAVSIEATIPFRGPDSQGRTWGEWMLERVNHSPIAQGLKPERLVKIIQRGVKFSNQDVGNFSDPDTSAFLDNTWKLLPESNTPLQHKDYTIGDYRFSLEKMEKFFQGLKPGVIYKEFKGEPTALEYASLMTGAERNLQLAKIYLGIKLVSLAVVEALAKVTGGDAPINLFLGEVRVAGHNSPRIEDYLPKPLGKGKDTHAVLYNLFTSGRNEVVPFDMKTSPLSAFLCETLTQDELTGILNQAKRMYSGKQEPRQFLEGLPKKVLSPVAKACSLMVVSRKEQLQEFI